MEAIDLAAQAHARLGLIALQADRCLASMRARERLARRVRASRSRAERS